MSLPKESKSFHSIYNEDLKNIDEHITLLHKYIISLVHSEIKSFASNCNSTDEFVSFIYSLLGMSLRSNVETLNFDITKSEKWLNKNKCIKFEESIKASINELDEVEKQLVNYIDFEKQLVIIEKINKLIEFIDCNENKVKQSINYGKFKTFFKSNKKLKQISISFFEQTKKLKDIDSKKQWSSITSDDFSFNKFKTNFKDIEQSYMNINYNIERLTNNIDDFREQQNLYNFHLSKLKNKSEEFYITELETTITNAPIDLNKIKLMQNYDFKYIDCFEFLNLVSKIHIFEFIKNNFIKSKEKINNEINNKQYSAIFNEYKNKSNAYREFSSSILNLSTKNEKECKKEELFKSMICDLKINNLETIGFSLIFGTIINNKN
jgi:hypothetical protein